jgi:hypothetical protein
VRILLDAHVSSRHIARRLSDAGHDVLALDQDAPLGRLADDAVLAFAAAQGRVLITHNVRHFAPIARSWAESRRSHGGVVFVTLAHNEYGAILRQLEEAFAARPAQDRWVDRVEFVART